MNILRISLSKIIKIYLKNNRNFNLKKKDILLWFFIILLLMPILFFPISPDSSIYLDSGRIIANGGKLYIDNIDLKQPLIYYIFTPVYLLLGYTELTVRAFDFLWQLATIISLFFLISKTINKKTAYIASFIFAVSYPALGYSQTVQCETFAALPMVWLIYFLTFHRKKFLYLFLSGLLVGVIAGLKFTMILILIAVLIYILADKASSKIKLINSAMIIAGTILGFCLTMLPLIDSEIYNGYKLVFQYLVFYSGTEANLIEALKLMIKNTGKLFGDRYSLILTISLATAIYQFLGKRPPADNKKVWRMLNISLLVMFFLFLTVVIERKFWDYHFARMYLPMFIFSAIGFKLIYKKIVKFYQKGNSYLKGVIIIGLIAAFILSPATRWLNTLRSGYYYFADTEKYDALYSEYISGVDVPLREHHKLVAKIVNKYLSKNDLVVVISTGSNAINHFLNTEKISAFRNSQFIFNPLKFPEWDYRFSKEIRLADWIIVQTDDSRVQVIGEEVSSWDMLKRDLDNVYYLSGNFELFEKVGNFLIFKRKFP